MQAPSSSAGLKPRGVQSLVVVVQFIVLTVAMLLTHGVATAAVPIQLGSTQVISVEASDSSAGADEEVAAGAPVPDACGGSCAPTCFADDSCVSTPSGEIAASAPQASTTLAPGLSFPSTTSTSPAPTHSLLPPSLEALSVFRI